MEHRLSYIINSNDKDILQQFKNRLSLVGIQTELLKCSDKYCYLEFIWDDSVNPNLYLKKNNSNKVGAKAKMLKYDGKPVTCGMIYEFRNMKHFSDAKIGSLFDVSESTISRRRKKHMSIGSFFEGSEVFFV